MRNSLIACSIESPLQFNQAVGGNMSAYQVAQQIPLPCAHQCPGPVLIMQGIQLGVRWRGVGAKLTNCSTGAGGPAPAYQVLQTQTNAFIALTVYPASFNLQASDYTQLGQQILVRRRRRSTR